MTPDLVPDYEVRQLSLCGGGVWSRSGWKWLWGYCLNRELTDAEVDEILGKINGLGPVRYEDTWEALERSTDLPGIWRNPLC